MEQIHKQPHQTTHKIFTYDIHHSHEIFFHFSFPMKINNTFISNDQYFDVMFRTADLIIFVFIIKRYSTYKRGKTVCDERNSFIGIIEPQILKPRYLETALGLSANSTHSNNYTFLKYTASVVDLTMILFYFEFYFV